MKKKTDIVTMQGRKIGIPGGPIPKNILSKEYLGAIGREKEKRGDFKKNIISRGNILNTYNHIAEVEAKSRKNNGLRFIKKKIDRLIKKHCKKVDKWI